VAHVHQEKSLYWGAVRDLSRFESPSTPSDCRPCGSGASLRADTGPREQEKRIWRWVPRKDMVVPVRHGKYRTLSMIWALCPTNLCQSVP